MILASILITSNEREETSLPPKVEENIASFKAVHPQLPHQLFTASSIRQLIKEHFDADVVDAFERLKPFAYKSDLARYCIMYLYGGVYADISVYFLRPWSPRVLSALVQAEAQTTATPIGLFRDFQSATVWDTANGVFSTPPGQKAFLQAIEMICRNVKSQYYGKNALCPTGPVLFGKAIAASCEPEDLVVGDSRWIEPGPDLKGIIHQRSHAFVFRNKLVALTRKRGGRPISDIGITGGNTYPEMWSAGDVYAAN